MTAETKTNQSARMKYITLTGLMAAMTAVMTAYICHVPTGVNGGYIHFGDSIIYIAAALLPTPYALAAAAIGGGLADLMTAPMWAPATIIIKMLITIPFTNKSAKIINVRNVAATVLAGFITCIGYFFAECIIFGSQSTAFIASVSGNLVQSAASAAVFIIFSLALDRVHIKNMLKNES